MTSGELRGCARGAVVGLALGDALGMTRRMEPPEGESRSRAQPRLGEVSTSLRQAVALGWLMVEAGGEPEHNVLADAWTELLDRDLIELGDPLENDDTARALLRRALTPGTDPAAQGVDAAAAVRAVVYGLTMPVDPARALVEAVARSTALTHDTRLGHAAAAAVAAGVSGGLDGADAHTQLGLLLNAADLGAEHGSYVPGPDLGTRVQWASALVTRAPEDPAGILDVLVGTSALVQEAVPTALALVSLHDGDPWEACRAAAALGGASPLIGGIAGALLGARHGIDAFPAASVNRLLAAHSDLRLLDLADALLGLRPAANTGDGQRLGTQHT